MTAYDSSTKNGVVTAQIKYLNGDDNDRTSNFAFEYKFANNYNEIEYRELGLISSDQEALDSLNSFISGSTNSVIAVYKAVIIDPSQENKQSLEDVFGPADLNYDLDLSDNDEVFIHIGGKLRVEGSSTVGTQTNHGPMIRLNITETAFEFAGRYVGNTRTIINFKFTE